MDENISKHASEMREILKRLLFLKNQLQIVVPEDLSKFTSRVRELSQEGKSEGIMKHDLFYFLGVFVSSQNDPMTMGDISRAMKIPMSTATRIVDWFVKQGYARRLPDPEDRRVIRVELTENGQQIFQVMNNFVLERITGMLSHFNEQEQEELVSLLQRLLSILESGS